MKASGERRGPEGWSSAEKRALEAISTPRRVQEYLDGIEYRCDDAYPPPVTVFRERIAHCFDGALFAAAALRRSGRPPIVVNLRAIRDDDHLLCIFREGRKYGAVAKSNFPGLRFREAVFRSLRELVMSYFEFYFNLEREKALRAYSDPLDLSRFDRYGWEHDPEAVPRIIEALHERRHHDLITRTEARSLARVDERLFKSQLLGMKRAGVRTHRS